MSDPSTPPTPKIIVAKDLRILSKILRILAYIVFVFNIYSLFRLNFTSLVAVVVAVVQVVVCSIGESASERSGYIYNSLRVGAIGCGIIVAYYIATAIILIISMFEIYTTDHVDSFILTLAWIVVLDCIAELGAYSALFGLFIKHALRAKKQLEASEFDPLPEEQNSTTFETV